MPEFRVQFSASADVYASVYLTADSEEEAVEKASTQVIKEGDAMWKHHGIQDDSITFTGVSEL
jgi:hypothetical protein